MRGWPCANVALRYPAGVVGLDVDNYDGKPAVRTLAQHEARLGALPHTWTITSRDDGISGTRLYRVEPGWQWRVGLAGGGVDVIQRSHRYSLIPPSLHPHGNRYRWLGFDGHHTRSWPTPSELPQLPLTWQQALRAPVHRWRAGQPRRPSQAQGPAAPLVDDHLVQFARECIRTGQAKLLRDGSGNSLQDLGAVLGIRATRAGHLETGRLRNPRAGVLARYGQWLQRLAALQD